MTALPGRPTAACNLSSARGWLNLILRRVDVDSETEATLSAAIESLRALEAKIIADWKRA